MAVELGEFEVRAAGENGLGDVGLGHANTEVVIDGPEAGVEEIMGGRGQGRPFSSPSGHLLMTETANRTSNPLDRSCQRAGFGIDLRTTGTKVLHHAPF